MSLVHRVEQYIRKEQLLQPGDYVIIAVSGGPDSTALLHILHALSGKWRLQLHAAHMDHGFRGAESRDEAEWVRALAEQLGVPCTVQTANIPRLVSEENGNPQEIARRVRYDFLIHIAKRLGANVIALGHHADDQAETILMRLLRGSSLSGIAGMSTSVKRNGVKLIRPFLRIDKDEIINYMKEHNFDYRIDSSNQERKYTRNRLRLDVMPLLKDFNPELTHTLNRMADIVREEDRLLDQLAHAEFSRLFHESSYPASNPSANAYVGSRNQCVKLDVALQRRVIKLILSYLCVHKETMESVHIERVREAMTQDAPTVVLHLPGVTFIREYDQLRFVSGRVERRTEAYSYTVSEPSGNITINEANMELGLACLEGEPARTIKDSNGFDEQSAYFDLERLTFPLTVRNRQPGDRIHLMNIQGTTKLKDLFINLKIPPSKRDCVPIVLDAEGRLLWICGIRRSRYAPVSETTKKVLRITVEQNESMSNDID